VRKGGLLTSFDFLGNTEIGDLDSTFIVDQDICAFDISMNNITIVKICETRKDLLDESLDQGFFECTILVEESSD
jgi:hypothetical protein